MFAYVFKLVITVCAVLVAMRCAPPFYMSSVVSQKQSLFTASGDGSVSAVPDIARLDIGVVSTNKNLKEAQNKTNGIIQKVMDAMQGLGIDEKEITTSRYSVSPEYNYKVTPQKIIGYSVSNNLSIKVLDFEKINSVITLATSSGANSVGNIRFMVKEDKQKELKIEARALAIQAAKEKAQALAGASGISLGRIINVQESTHMPYAGRRNAMYMAKAAPEASPGIQAGSTKVSSNITLTYEVR